MLTDEQVQKVKTTLLEQLESFPEEQRKIIKHKILSMNNSEIEEFIKANEVQKNTDKPDSRCIFCSIVKKELKAHILAEDKEYIAILEINPLTKGHTLIIPKAHYPLEKIPESSIEFAKKIASLLSEKLKPKDIQFQKNEILSHAHLEIIPIYGEEKLERHKATEEELTQLSKLLKPEEKQARVKIEEKPIEVMKEPTSENKKSKPEELPKIEIEQKEEKPKLPKLKPRLNWI